MAGTIWIPGAERLPCSLPGGVITSTAPPRATWHTVEADPGTAAVWASMIRVLNNKKAEPQVLWDPLTDRLGQFMPLNLSGRALKNDGTSKTNRTGRVNIQIEVIGRAAKPFTAYWKPGKNFRALMAALRSHGIVDAWPAGPPPRFVQVGTGGYNKPENPRSRTTWLTKGGHYSHSQVPGNDHGDCGGISTAALFAAGKPASSGGTPTPPPEDDVISDKQMQELKNHQDLAADKAGRKWALYEILYGLETEDDRTAARQAYVDAKAAGKPEAVAMEAAESKLSTLRADIKKAQAGK